MRHIGHHRKRSRRRGIAVTEAAILLPIFVLLFLGVVMLGWTLNEMQQLHNGARQGARAVMSQTNSNSDIHAAALAALSDKIDKDEVKVSIKKLNENGDEEYEVQSLDENELGKLIKVTVTYTGGLMSQLAGETERGTSVIVRRPE